MSQPTASSAQVDRDIVEYGRFSGWALVALLLGLLSAAAIAGPILWFIPLLGIVISLVAMKKIKASDCQLSGWHVALLGLLLSLFFGMAGPARTVSRRYYLETRAAHFAVKFMELLQQNQPAAAFQLTLPAGARKPIAADGADADEKNPSAKKAYDDFLALAPVKSLLRMGPQAKLELLSSTISASGDAQDEVVVRYRIHNPEVNGAKSTTVLMDVQRTLAYSSQTEQWRIVPWALSETEQ
jgi:hypothetical protein